MQVNIEIVDWWGVKKGNCFFLRFSGPLVYGSGPMNSAQFACSSVWFLVCSFVTLLEIIISIFLDAAQEVKGPKGLKNDRKQIFVKIHFLGKDV